MESKASEWGTRPIAWHGMVTNMIFKNLKIEKISIKERDFDEKNVKNNKKRAKLMKFEEKNCKICIF